MPRRLDNMESPRRNLDLTGQVFGRLTVLKIVIVWNQKNGYVAARAAPRALSFSALFAVVIAKAAAALTGTRPQPST